MPPNLRLIRALDRAMPGRQADRHEAAFGPRVLEAALIFGNRQIGGENK
jgi:hypothetical protein